MTADIETAVIGAGVVGLAIAAELATRGHDVLVLERNSAIGQETSSRSSEVIHAGIYYPKGSLKAELCVEGRQLLYRFAAERGVGFRRTGKLIVATSEAELAKLAGIVKAAAANGVEDLRLILAAEAQGYEPELNCVAAIDVPSTGIVDSRELMIALEGQLTNCGGSVVLSTAVSSVSIESPGVFALDVMSSGESARLTCRNLVVSAGHGMSHLSATLPRRTPYTPPTGFLAKGHYFTLRTRAPFQRLIYPLPEEGGLGTHLTLDLQGRARFGPDVSWIDRLDYRFDDPDGARQRDFERAIRRYWPGLPDDALDQGYTGIRPKISGPGMPARDFAIHGSNDHGIDGLVALYGIESPGLTSSLAIARRVGMLLGG